MAEQDAEHWPLVLARCLQCSCNWCYIQRRI